MKKALLVFAAALMSVAVSAQTAWSEDFESVTLSSNGIGSMPEGWTTYADNVSNYSQYAAFGQSWCTYDFGWYGKSAFCMTYTNQQTPCDRWLVSPQISVPTDGNYSLYFDVNASQYNEKLSVLVSTTGNAKADFTGTLMAVTTLNAGAQTKLLSLSDYAGQDIYIAFRCTTTDGVYTVIDNVAVKVVAPNAISLAGISAPNYTPMGNNFTFDVTVRNEGSDPMTSFQIDYTVAGGSQQTSNLSGITIEPFAYYTTRLTTNMATAGAATINLTVSNPNGAADVDASDNSGSIGLTVYDPTSTVERTSVLEHFTTAACPNCPSGHQRLDAAVNGRTDRVIWIAHHSGYYTDGMTISESEDALKYFNEGGSTYAPACMIDRSVDNATSEDPGPVFFPGNDIRNVLTNALARPALVTCQISDLNYNEQTRELSVTVSGLFNNDVFFDSPRVHLFLMEDSIIANQSGAGSNYQHNHVLRACISGLDGVSEGFTTTNSGDSYSKTFTYTLPTSLRANKCWLGAFVSNHNDVNVNRCEILNGAKTGRLLNHADPTTTGITAVEASIEVKTYPNPATEMAIVSAESTIRSYEVVNAMGQVVMAAENVNADVLELNVSNMAQGVYFLNVTTDKGVGTQRLTVVK